MAPAGQQRAGAGRAVAPVVSTSSTSTTTRPATCGRRRTANAPATLRAPRRRARARPGAACPCGAPGRRGAQRPGPRGARARGQELRLVEPALAPPARVKRHRHEHVARRRAGRAAPGPRRSASASRAATRRRAAVLQLVDQQPRARPRRARGCAPRAKGWSPRRQRPQTPRARGERAARSGTARPGGGAAPPSRRRTAGPRRGVGEQRGRTPGRRTGKTTASTGSIRARVAGSRAIRLASRARSAGRRPAVTGGPAPASPGRRGSAWPRAPPPAASGSSRPRTTTQTPKRLVLDADERLVHELQHVALGVREAEQELLGVGVRGLVGDVLRARPRPPPCRSVLFLL